MSAWFVSKSDIDLIVSHLRPTTVEEGTKIGKMLWGENLKSLRYRYPHHEEHQAEAREVKAYVFRQYEGLNLSALATIVACYEYQSCEHDGWETSKAHKLTKSIREQIGKGEQKGPWGTHDDPAKIAQVANV